jgi:uncharacterized protein (TIGR00255 family)
MTGYGRAAYVPEEGGADPAYGLTVEIRAVNHRYLDTLVRCPRQMMFIEDAVRKRVSAQVSRGKVEVIVSKDKDESGSISVDFAAAEGYVNAARELEARFGVPGDLSAAAILRLSEVVQASRADTDEQALSDLVLDLTDRAVAAFNEMRAAEGARLCADILDKSREIERLVTLAEERSPVTVAAYRARLSQKLSEVLENTALDESRILTEAAIYADRVSVDEETVRLRSHLAALRDMLEKGGTIGRKLDFLAQELGREANTIGSKANDTEMGRIVLDMKNEIEKIREQVQNIE